MLASSILFHIYIAPQSPQKKKKTWYYSHITYKILEGFIILTYRLATQKLILVRYTP